jgi:signal transduction histidine kinase
MNSTWPLESSDDDTALPPPWDGDVRFDDQQTESAFLVLQYREPALALRICRSVFCRAEARGDRRAATHALYLAFVSLFNSSQRATADRMLALVRERAIGMGASQLSARIELSHAARLSEQGEHARAMIIRQRALDFAMALGDSRLTFLTLGSLAVSAAEAGEGALVLSLCEQQEPLLTEDDPVIAGMRFHHANTMAVAWQQIARASEAAGRRANAREALQRARMLAQSACALANDDRQALHLLDTLVQILLLLDEVVEARAQVERCAANLRAEPSLGSELWCVLELTRARIDAHAGKADARTLETLQTIEASVGQGGTDLQLLIGDVRQVLLRAQEQLGHFEQALASHKRATDGHAQLQSAQSRQRMKMLRHTVLAIRAEAVEFITHDLLTPLAAAQTWSQALLRERLSAASAQSLRAAYALLAAATSLSDQCLGLWRAELTPRVRLQALDLGALADDICESFQPPWPSRRVRLERELRIGTCIQGDRILLTHALTALLSYAAHQAHEGTAVRLRLWIKTDGKGDQAVLSVGFHGSLPPHAVRTRIFQRFADGAVVGTGELGWLLVSRVAQLHVARLQFKTVAAEGNNMQLAFSLATTLHDGTYL